MTLTGLMLQAGTFSFGEFLTTLEQMDFFRYVLPFLLVFAVVYAVLTQVPVFRDNKGAGVVVALAVGLLSLQFDIVPSFFQVLFPRFGIALALLLVVLVLAGAFISDDDSKNAYKWIFFGIGMLMFIVLLIVSFGNLNFIGSDWWGQYGNLAIGLTMLITAVILIIVYSKPAGPKPPRTP